MRNRNIIYTVLAAFGIYALSIIRPLMTGKDVVEETGVMAFALGMIYIIVAIILLISDKTKEIGTTLLICGGVMLLIGFAICSKTL